MPLATKLNRACMYNMELPSIKSHKSLITWSFNATRNIRSVISLLQ